MIREFVLAVFTDHLLRPSSKHQLLKKPRGQVQSKTWRMMSALEHPQVLDCACPLALCIVLELTATPLVTMSSLTDACSFKFRRDMVWFDHEPEPA